MHPADRHQQLIKLVEGVLVPTAERYCPPIDAAEAWRRAQPHLYDHHDAPVLVHIEEFEEGFQAIPVPVTLPEPPSVPTVETETTLVIDKTTGTISRWPLLHLDVLAQQYRRYHRQEPMTFGDH